MKADMLDAVKRCILKAIPDQRSERPDRLKSDEWAANARRVVRLLTDSVHKPGNTAVFYTSSHYNNKTDCERRKKNFSLTFTNSALLFRKQNHRCLGNFINWLGFILDSQIVPLRLACLAVFIVAGTRRFFVSNFSSAPGNIQCIHNTHAHKMS